MNALILTLFVSLLLALLGLVELALHIRRGEHRHAERLALLPLADDGAIAVQDSQPTPLRDGELK